MALNFLVQPYGTGRSLLTTETRTATTDPVSRTRFRRYWRFIGPFAGVIMRRWLELAKQRAEREIRGVTGGRARTTTGAVNGPCSERMRSAGPARSARPCRPTRRSPKMAFVEGARSSSSGKAILFMLVQDRAVSIRVPRGSQTPWSRRSHEIRATRSYRPPPYFDMLDRKRSVASG